MRCENVDPIDSVDALLSLRPGLDGTPCCPESRVPIGKKGARLQLLPSGDCVFMAMRTDQTDNRPIRSVLRYLVTAPAAWSLVWPLLLLFGSYIGFNRYYAAYFTAEFESIDPQLVSVTEPHEFVRADIVSEVYQVARLNQLSPLDSQATVKIADAFKSHPWVRDVQGVRKLPGGAINVQLDYREPVAVFHVTSERKPIDENLFFVLDGEGNLLPNEHMTLGDTPRFIHIEVSEAYPTGTEGTGFGDRRVEHAALLARLLNAVKDQIRISKITVSGDPRMNLVPQLELITGDNTAIYWGSPPGMEQPNERGARAKLADLVSGNFQDGSDLRIATPPSIGRRR